VNESKKEEKVAYSILKINPNKNDKSDVMHADQTVGRGRKKP